MSFGTSLYRLFSECILRQMMHKIARTNESAKQSAFDKVFGTLELAELIFLRVSMFDLLANVQRTCKSFQKIIQESSPIQEILFMKPIAAANQYYADGNWWRELGWEWNAVGYARVIKNPLLDKLWTSQRKAQGNPALWYPKASWRRQLVTQPPLIYFQLSDGFGDGFALQAGDGHGFITTKECEGGLRMWEISNDLRRWPVFWIAGSQCWQSYDYEEWEEVKALAKVKRMEDYREKATEMLGQEPQTWSEFS